VDLKDTRVLRALYQLGSAETMDHNATCERFRMERTDVYIALRGSFHFTPGAAYEDCDNGNRSAVHWDLVAIQRPEHGGGEIWFDDVLIRRDGLFVLPELEGLNPDVLIGAGG
jgi:leucyl aminopeptidase (aminopeptidase T)